MSTHKFLLDIALILGFSKMFEILTRKFKVPQVVGALLAGVVLGPALLGFVRETDFLYHLSEIGVILLMFLAGMESDVKGLICNWKASLLVAILGFIVPLGGGLILCHYTGVFDEGLIEKVFIGLVLSATSVSVTVATLKEMGKLNTKVSDTLLGAAIIDDIIGIVALSIISGLKDTSGVSNSGNTIWITILFVTLFCVFAVVMWVVFSKFFSDWFAETEKGLQRYAVIATVVCFLLSFAAEYLFGVANIIGAFLAGLIFSDNSKNAYIQEKSETLSNLFFAPIFFTSVGLKVDFQYLNSSIVLFAIALTVIAIASKIIGCGIGAKISGFNTKDSLIIGSGMVSRGEVALIVANKGIEMGIVTAEIVSPIVLMVLITTIIAPILIKRLYG
ncbi:MAG: cation:proton antiporter [Lachnospirales bacterium]